MKHLAAVILAAMTLGGCSPSAPTSPDPKNPGVSPSPATSGSIRAMAVDANGACIAGGTFEIVSPQGLAREVLVQQTPCSVWDYEGGVVLEHLDPGAAITIRASAPGYDTVERSLRPRVSGVAEIFELRKSSS